MHHGFGANLTPLVRNQRTPEQLMNNWCDDAASVLGNSFQKPGTLPRSRQYNFSESNVSMGYLTESKSPVDFDITSDHLTTNQVHTVPSLARNKEHSTTAPDFHGNVEKPSPQHALQTTPVSIFRQTPQCSALRASFNAYEIQQSQDSALKITPTPRKRHFSALHSEESGSNSLQRNICIAVPSVHDALSIRITRYGATVPSSSCDTAVRRRLFSVGANHEVSGSGDRKSRVSLQCCDTKPGVRTTQSLIGSSLRRRSLDGYVVCSGQTRTQPIRNEHNRAGSRRSLKREGPLRRIFVQCIKESHDMAKTMMSPNHSEIGNLPLTKMLDANRKQIPPCSIAVQIKFYENGMLYCILVSPFCTLQLSRGDHVFVVCSASDFSFDVGTLALVLRPHAICCNFNLQRNSGPMDEEMVLVFGAAMLPLPSDANFSRLPQHVSDVSQPNRYKGPYGCNVSQDRRSSSTLLTSNSCVISTPSLLLEPNFTNLLALISPHEHIVLLEASIIWTCSQTRFAIMQDAVGQIAIAIPASSRTGQQRAGSKIVAKWHVGVQSVPLQSVLGVVPSECLHQSWVQKNPLLLKLPVLTELERISGSDTADIKSNPP